MADTQQFRIAMNDALTQLEELGRELPLRLQTDITSDEPERVEVALSLGQFPIAVFRFDFPSNTWKLERLQQTPLSFATLPEAIAQVRADYFNLFKDLTNWRIHGREWKQQP